MVDRMQALKLSKRSSKTQVLQGECFLRVRELRLWNVEGLLIAEELGKLRPLLPSKRIAWRFPDAYTYILPISKGTLWLFNRPPNPRIAYLEEMPPQAGPNSGFQDLLVSRANGALVDVEQIKLDRVVRLTFGPGEGFVPTPPVILVAELTGRNCNLILLDEDGKILGAARDIGADVNRFRQVRSGLPYTPPPPYEKLDPRTTSDEVLEQTLTGKSLKKVRSLVDGIGPDLSKALAVTSGISVDKKLEPADLSNAIPVLRRLAKEPSAVMKEALELPDVDELRRREARVAMRERLRIALEKERTLLKNRLKDIDKARDAAAKASEIRNQADVLMAYQHQVPKNVTSATLTDFEGNDLPLQLDPKLSAVENAQAYYERARKRENRVIEAESREAQLKPKLAEVEGYLDKLETLKDEELKELLERYAPKAKAQKRTEPGIRYEGPHGYPIIVGRNSRENDIVTFRLARSRDVWLHAQGYPGSHVIIKAGNTEVPFDTILFAAQLAAAYSKAGQSDNVPVDYALKKDVWKAKGAAPGAVHYAQQKTVYVTPSRRPNTT